MLLQLASVEVKEEEDGGIWLEVALQSVSQLMTSQAQSIFWEPVEKPTMQVIQKLKGKLLTNPNKKCKIHRIKVGNNGSGLMKKAYFQPISKLFHTIFSTQRKRKKPIYFQ